jgi:hypothetical protein
VPSIRAGRRKDTLKFQAGYDIRGFVIAIHVMGCWIIHLAATGQDNGSHVKCEILLLVIEPDGIGGAEFFTGLALSIFEVNAIFRVEGVLEGDGLGIFDEGRLSLIKSCFVFIDYLFRALFSAYSTGDTFIHINVPGVLGKLDLKISLFPGNALYF